MDITPELFLDSTDDWSVLYFEDKECNAGPHFHILIPTIDSQYLVICIITSKVKKQKERYAPCGEDQNVIDVSPSDLACLNIPSVVVCPNAELVQKDILLDRIAQWNQNKSMCGGIPETLKQKIFFAIKQSQIVSDDIKEFI